LTVGVGRGLNLTVALPWLEIGSLHWDSIPIEFHNLFSLPQGPHGDVPNGPTLVWISRGTTSVQARRELEGSGIGDLMVVLGTTIANRKD
jgi:hypothetical protein